MRFGDLLSLNLWASLAEVLSPSPTRHIVDLGYAKYRGNLSYPDVVAYLGLPYAEPPLGEGRFRAPLPLDTARVAQESGDWVVDATEYPEFCIQGTSGVGDAGGAGSEDCLKINIYAPAGAKKGDALPVLVYIHGGDYAYGNPRNWPFDHWVHQSPDVVIASVYYRLNSFGFLSTPSSDLDLNAGFLDQVLALKWVKQYISAFGGDPRLVTLSGHGAGASSTVLHLVSTVSSDLFSQAILQSVYRTPVPTPKQQAPLFDDYANRAGCGNWTIPTASRLTCLREAPVSVLARAQDGATNNFNGSYNVFRPVVDGDIITQFPTLSLIQGKFANVPVLVGATSDDTLSPFDPDYKIPLRAFFPALTDHDLEWYDGWYSPDDFPTLAKRHIAMTGDSEVICARYIIVNATLARDTPAYGYRYNQPVPRAGLLDVDHGAENWMMFGGTRPGPNGTTEFQPHKPRDTEFARELIAYWLSFVRAGDPSTRRLEGSPEWPPYTPRTGARLVLQQGSGDAGTSGSYVEAGNAMEDARCRFVANLHKHHEA